MTTSRPRRALITGGAGFIATNVAERLLRDGWQVRLLDNLSRPGVAENVAWLKATHGRGELGDPPPASGPRVELLVGDVRDARLVARAVRDVDRVFHFAAQVAVTTSLVDPLLDFEVNARGTLNLLEAIRSLDRRPTLLFTSTNKVYGHLNDLPLRIQDRRYQPVDGGVAQQGISEGQPLDFHSPYGCSKGAAEQYVLDYARTFGLPAAVFRMSCIYGPHQFGTEDQGWVAHFLIQALKDRPLTLYGDGRQVRDVLFIEDLVDAMMRAHESMDAVGGRAFNIGGGPARTVSLLELIELIGDLIGGRPAYRLDAWRSADQRYYVSDTTRFQRATGWTPRIPVAEGLRRLAAWLAAHDRPAHHEPPSAMASRRAVV
ncbi:MAG: NAD-dependent epimerase/dehydratase family protein [Vicinamibacterales bacterium]